MVEQLPEGLKPQEFQDKPLIEVLIEDALVRYNSQTSFINEYKKLEPYLHYHACVDAVGQSGKSPDDLLSQLTQQTTLKPQDMANSLEFSVSASDTWDKFKEYVNINIIHMESLKRYPEIKDKDQRREEEFYIWNPNPNYGQPRRDL